LTYFFIVYTDLVFLLTFNWQRQTNKSEQH